MSFTFTSMNLKAAQATLNEWIDRETRPITWHKLQLFFSKLGKDIGREQGVTAVDCLAGTLDLAVDAASLVLADAGGGPANLDLSGDLEVAGMEWRALIVNTSDAAETITVRDSADVTITTLAQAESKYVYWNGTAWAASIAL